MTGVDVVTVFLAASSRRSQPIAVPSPVVWTCKRTEGSRGRERCRQRVMLGASVSLVLEGADRSVWRAGAGALAGVVFIVVVSRFLHGLHRELALGSLRGEDAVEALLIVAVMTAARSPRESAWGPRSAVQRPSES